MSDSEETSVRIVGFCSVCHHPLMPCDCESCLRGEGPGLDHAELPEGFETEPHLATLGDKWLTMCQFLLALESNPIGGANALITHDYSAAAIQTQTINAVNMGWAKFVGDKDHLVITEEGKEALAHLRSNQVPS